MEHSVTCPDGHTAWDIRTTGIRCVHCGYCLTCTPYLPDGPVVVDFDAAHALCEAAREAKENYDA